MPLHKLQKDATHAYALWKIEESEAELSAMLPDHNLTLPKHPTKRLEALASRVVTIALLAQFNETFMGIRKDEFGKPFLNNSTLHISQSHSYPYVVVIISNQKIVGIDIEQPKANLLKVAPRIFSEKELAATANDLQKLCVYWCAKETLIKIYGKKDLNLKEEINIETTDLGKEGLITGNILRKHNESSYVLKYLVSDDFVLVHN